MNSSLLFLVFLATVPGFGPNVRVDHQYQSQYTCGYCAIALGPGAPSSQPVYVAFEGDTLPGGRCDVWFQKSTDAGRTWLPTDLLIQRGEPWAGEPDITTDSAGNVYVAYSPTDSAGHDQIVCVRSSDGGATWTAPVPVADSSDGRIGFLQIAAGTAGNLLVAWNQGGVSHVFSSVSTDSGATWSPRVRVDEDTTNEGCYHPDVFIQPGTNHYLVAADVPRWFETSPHIRPCAYLYRSTDRGLTFQPGVQLDTFDHYASWPHVVADRDHIICDYFGEGQHSPMLVEARTFYTQPDTWGTPYSVTNLDSLYHLDYSGPLALSADGRVHTALMIYDTVERRTNVSYASSWDHGVSWSDLALVNEDTLSTGFPDIGADSDGYAYVVWAQGPDGCFRIWFATNNPLAIAEQPTQQRIGEQPFASVIRGVLLLPRCLGLSIPSTLLDIGGRKIMDLTPGANDVSRLSPGVYFVREAQAQAQAQAVRKVVVTR